jgi:ABC-2 type transport system permease protein
VKVETRARSSVRQQLWALGRRDTLIERSYPLSLVTRVFGIAMTVCTYYFIGKIVDPSYLEDYQGHYFEFVLVGLLLNALSSAGLAAFSDTIKVEQSNGTLEVLFTTPASMSTVFLGSLIVPAALLAIETTIVMTSAVVLLGADLHASGAVTALLAVPPTLAFYAAVGAASAGFLVLSKRGDPVTPVVTKLTNFLAGTVFPVSVLPGALQFLAHLLPPLYALEVMRAGLVNGQSITEVWPEYLVLVGSVIVLLPLALAFFRHSLRVARQTGTLGSY